VVLRGDEMEDDPVAPAPASGTVPSCDPHAAGDSSAEGRRPCLAIGWV